MLKTDITYFGQAATVVCDHKCEKAFGINTRPKSRGDHNVDDLMWYADNEVPVAPEDPGTYEGGHGKPMHPERHNKWCVRECERSSICRPGQPLRYPDWSKRRYNIPSLHGLVDNYHIYPDGRPVAPPVPPPHAASIVNEFGNTIEMSVQELPIDGQQGIRMSMRGPRSTAENHMTRQEAEALHELLGAALGK